MTTGGPVALSPRSRVVVLRVLPGLGDMLCLIPALRSLRAAAPGAHVTLVGLESSRWMLDRYPSLLDGFVPVTYWPGVPEAAGDPETWTATRRAWDQLGPDLALQLHGSGHTSNDAMLSLPARHHAGHHPADSGPPGKLFRPWPDHGHESERLLGLVRWLGGREENHALEFPVRPGDAADLRRLVPPHAPYACVHPGASRPDRRWSGARFARVGDHLARRGLRVLVTGSTGERDLGLAVAAEMREPAEVVAGRTDLGTMAAMLHGAAVSVSNDTGVAHLAAAVDARAVVVFTTSDAGRWAPLPSSRRTAVLDGTSPSVDAVIAAVDELLSTA